MDISAEENVSYDYFTHWSVAALQDYCGQRGYPISGCIADLAAMAYTAYRTKAPKQLTEVEKLQEAKQAYLDKLLLPDGTLLTDPLKATEGWEGEEAAMIHWPHLTYGDIIQYFNSKRGVDTKETLNKYKQGKAFSFYSAEYVKEVLFHKVSNEMCVLKTCVTRSTSVNEPPHKVWVCTTIPNGEILRAYCTCTAGLHQTWNHLAGLLFRVEAAVTAGLTDPTCTSLANTWVIPASKNTVKLGEVRNFNFVQPCAGKKKTRPLVAEVKRAYQPYSDTMTEEEKRNNLMANLSLIKPKSAICQLWRAEKEDTVLPIQMKDAAPVAMYLEDYIVGQTLKLKGSIDDKVQYMRSHLPKITHAEVKSVSKQTMGQFNNEKWVRARIGRITASNFGKVTTRLKTLENPNDCRSKDVGPLLVQLMGYNPPDSNLPPLKYGRENESKARAAYIQHQTSLGHVNVQVDLSGLWVCRDHVFLAASPDLLVQCDCCGQGLVEIKCPYTLRDSNILSTPPAFLCLKNNQLTLKQSHQYFAQVQGQLAIVQREWCDFVVYCPSDILVERIAVSQPYWEDVLPSLVRFYNTYLLKEVISKHHRPISQIREIKTKYKKSNYLKMCGRKGDQLVAPDENNADDHGHDCQADKAICDVGTNTVVGNGDLSEDFFGASRDDSIIVLGTSPDKSRVLMDKTNIPSTSASQSVEDVHPTDQPEKSYCPVCKSLCSDDATQFKYQCVLCEQCFFWHHMRCVGMTKKSWTV